MVGYICYLHSIFICLGKCSDGGSLGRGCKTRRPRPSLLLLVSPSFPMNNLGRFVSYLPILAKTELLPIRDTQINSGAVTIRPFSHPSFPSKPSRSGSLPGTARSRLTGVSIYSIRHRRPSSSTTPVDDPPPVSIPKVRPKMYLQPSNTTHACIQDTYVPTSLTYGYLTASK